EPDGPSIAKNWPAAISRSRSSTATTVPKVLRSRLSLIAGADSAGASGDIAEASVDSSRPDIPDLQFEVLHALHGVATMLSTLGQPGRSAPCSAWAAGASRGFTRVPAWSRRYPGIGAP